MHDDDLVDEEDTRPYQVLTVISAAVASVFRLFERAPFYGDPKLPLRQPDKKAALRHTPQ